MLCSITMDPRNFYECPNWVVYNSWGMAKLRINCLSHSDLAQPWSTEAKVKNTRNNIIWRRYRAEKKWKKKIQQIEEGPKVKWKWQEFEAENKCHRKNKIGPWCKDTGCFLSKKPEKISPLPSTPQFVNMLVTTYKKLNKKKRKNNIILS